MLNPHGTGLRRAKHALARVGGRLPCVIGPQVIKPHLCFASSCVVNTSCEEGERDGEEGMRDGKMRDIGRCTNMSIMS
jgi:hypothetical protein